MKVTVDDAINSLYANLQWNYNYIPMDNKY